MSASVNSEPSSLRVLPTRKKRGITSWRATSRTTCITCSTTCIVFSWVLL
jgi:hypothetical protein